MNSEVKIPDSIPENKRKHPFVAMLYTKRHIVNHIKKGGTIKELKDKGFKFAAPL